MIKIRTHKQADKKSGCTVSSFFSALFLAFYVFFLLRFFNLIVSSPSPAIGLREAWVPVVAFSQLDKKARVNSVQTLQSFVFR